MKFEDLNLSTTLLEALSKQGIISPTAIQETVFPVVMSGADLCGIAQTGTGKTLAYLLPLLRLWRFTKEKNPGMLIIVPTRELVMQVVEEARMLTEYMSVEIEGVYGGVNINTQKIALHKKLDLVVATPGRLYDLVLHGALKLKNIKKLVIDEVDEMLELGFRPQLMNIMQLLPIKRQNLLFSATLTPDVEKVINDYFYNPRFIETVPSGTPLENIAQFYYKVENFNTKINLLRHLLLTEDGLTKVLIFAPGRKLADYVFEQLAGIDGVGIIHSNKDQNFRFGMVDKFETGEVRFLVATDIISRGIDITDVSHVINLDVPATPENYMHRIGRTGRATQQGTAISFATEAEQKNVKGIEQLMNKEISALQFPEDVAVSDVLIDSEIPKKNMAEIQLKRPADESEGAFHTKSAKNTKVNSTTSRKEQMMKKYGKPKKRRPK